ncbi:putative NLR family CARD domain-containing protein 4-like [Apostichopus japonicus]|uniref:Putative NLR family CARD domain-containing protein 4-like n=1 Tax=Stichopus japonicus TaxID=307972 RepID=A0A2G8JK23_STIJA|nr:putative NLR family CARD domain-containing protein 4-like [Apostichopus japonicus]
MERLAYILFLFIWIPETVQGRDQGWTGCYTPQYAEINQEGYIMCKFPPDFKKIFWYDDASNDDSIPIITRSKNVTGGVGYDSGEYRMFSNGSLIINNVSMDHDRAYKVIYFDQEGLYYVFSVSLAVTVTPIDRRPKIKECGGEDHCLIKASNTSTLTCSLRGSRPLARLQWFKQTDEGLELIPTTIESEFNHNDNRTMNAFSHLELLGYRKNLLVSFVCQAALKNKADFMSTEGLVDMFSINQKVNSSVIYYKINSLANFTCSLDKPKTLLWKVKLRGGKYETLAILQGGMSKVLDKFSGDFLLHTNGTLVAPVVKLSHEGEYVCFTNESTANNILTSWNLTIIVPPSPSQVVVAECPSVYDRQCIIESPGKGTLTCSVSGVRPLVTLEWIVNDESRVTLSGQKLATTASELFDVTLSTEYKLTTDAKCNEVNKLTCAAYGPAESFFQSSHQTILVRVNCSNEESGQTPPKSHANSTFIGIVVIIFIILAVLLLVFVIRGKPKCCRKQDYREVPRQISTGYSKYTRTKFIAEVRQRYENMLNQSNPKVYVPNKLHLRTQDRNWMNRSQGENLKGYENLFKNDKLRNQNVLIEGDTGLGKTTLAFQLIKMWLHKDEDEDVDFDLVIYLSLQNVTSENEYTCIRKQLLSESWDIDDSTIQNIIADVKRVLFIFDDWEQFQNNHCKESFVYKLLVNKQEEKNKVLILTTPSPVGVVFSDEQPIVKIAQFDDEEIHKYLQETLKRRNINDIFERIVDNSNIYELCKIPLFLSVIAPIIEDDMFNIDHAFGATIEDIRDYLHCTDILTCQYLFIFACGLSKDKKLLVPIVRSLLQKEEYYPFPISDCIALCCFEAKPEKLEPSLLSEISASEHRFHIKASDGRNVVNAKAFLIDSCAKEKVEFGSLAITEHVKEIGSDKITLSTGACFELPEIIQSYYIVASKNKITNKDLLALIQGSRRLQILFLYNNSEPEYECAELFETTDLERTLVVWAFCQNEDLTLFTPSSKCKCWTSLEGSLTIKELRKTEMWKNSENQEEIEKEYRMSLKFYKDIGSFLNSRPELDEKWKLQTENYVRGVTTTFTKYVNIWHKVINDLSDQLKSMGNNDFDPEDKDIIVDNPKDFLKLIPSIKKIFLNIHQL